MNTNIRLEDDDLTSPPLRRRAYNLPCPIGLNSSVEFIDAERLTGGLLATIEPWFPLSDVTTGQNNTSKRRRSPTNCLIHVIFFIIILYVYKSH
jgi:hypothetical protein